MVLSFSDQNHAEDLTPHSFILQTSGPDSQTEQLYSSPNTIPNGPIFIEPEVKPLKSFKLPTCDSMQKGTNEKVPTGYIENMQKDSEFEL